MNAEWTEPLIRIGVEQVIARLGTPHSVVSADGSIIDKYVGVVPELLIDVWRAVGFSGYADGLLWLCNPDEWQPVVDEWISDMEMPFHDQWTPFTRTAFGVLTMWGARTGKSLTIDTQNGLIIPVDQTESMIDELDIDLQVMVALDVRPEVREFSDKDGDDDEPMFRRVHKRLGDLDASTMYGCVPAVGLGGSFTPRGMQIVNAVEHVRFLSTVTPRQVMNWKF
ncbi:GAD-like domain-containing protein [Nocardia lasii]|uniref:GAD-like domain-containing protein n=1 Tax=Nocardia lasii TaxID=1616107 RepID=A0ABW1JPY4_9NOCA